jgi:cytochrome c-type biogenesis protein CcmF
VYLVLAGVVNGRAEMRINFNPLVAWVWQGGMLMAIGGLIVMWPVSERRRQSGYVAELAPAAIGAGTP